MHINRPQARFAMAPSPRCYRDARRGYHQGRRAGAAYVVERVLMHASAAVPVPTDRARHARPQERPYDRRRRAYDGCDGEPLSSSAEKLAQCSVACGQSSFSSLAECNRCMDCCHGQEARWLGPGGFALRRAGHAALNGTLSVELTSACSLWASPSRAELTALGSMTVLDEAGGSAAGGGAEVPNGVFVQLILRLQDCQKGQFSRAPLTA